jgi:hypothetical protein
LTAVEQLTGIMSAAFSTEFQQDSKILNLLLVSNNTTEHAKYGNKNRRPTILQSSREARLQLRGASKEGVLVSGAPRAGIRRGGTVVAGGW